MIAPTLGVPVRQLLALFLTVVLAAASCSDDRGSTSSTDDTTTAPPGDDDSDDSAGDVATTTTTEPVPTGPAPGVTDDTIKIGITYVDLEPVRDFIDLDHGDYEAAYRAVIDDINANGGINGRLLEPVMAGVSPLGSTEADETCVRMAQDEGVFAVIGFHFGDTPLCYLEVEQVAIIGGTMTEERLARASSPWFSTEPSSDLDLDALETFRDRGLFDAPFAVYGTVIEPDLFDQTLARLSDLGIEPVAEAVLDADANDLNDQVAKVQLIVENFRTAGAETVLVVGSGPVSWANGAEGMSYRPRLLMTNADSANALADDSGARDLTVLAGAVLAALYGPNDEQFAEPLMQDCVGVLEAAGVEVPDPGSLPDGAETDPFVSAHAACRNLTLFTAIAEAAGEVLNYGSFQRAGETLGAIQIPGYPDPFVFGPPPSSDGDPAVYLFGFDEAEVAFVPDA